ncbi:MAG: peptide-methionine (S)-S-oxide reductase MsrA [Candidatus Bathyarchaeota archaeon]|nr:peptide-methionine (S)-S-oxide reductase MsrA [Candidatus Bathyarchaeota archaeon]
METITFAGGCFWCSEAVFSIVKGVEKVEPGYTGGSVVNPSYEQVSSGTTGHAEAVQVTFDSKIISLVEILEIFFATHDPTSVNRQGADIGTQYRSAIFYHNKEQKMVIEKVIVDLNRQKLWDASIVTLIEPLEFFYPAESYHKDYYKKHPKQAYCQAVIAPKISKLHQRYLSKLKAI